MIEKFQSKNILDSEELIIGLFDFVTDIGKKLFDKEEDESKAVTEHLAEDNPGVEEVRVTVENGTAKISGVASTATVEKAVLMAGNIAGINNVNIDEVKIESGEPLATDDEFYVIEKGDTLWKIAEKPMVMAQNTLLSLKQTKK